ncbi:MAG: flagellar hook-length control protein FliK [Gammaproteobacteria bacterium]|jgi:flagellar hook-length control protein FliK|nr:flagellar hook-length control protein FliK [Gammaproteobacteria bacterium]
MDMTVNLFNTQNEQLPQLSDLSVNNRAEGFGTCFEDAAKPKIEAGEELPVPGNEMPVQSVVLFENVLKDKLVNVGLDEVLHEKTISPNNVELNDNQNDIEQEQRFVLVNDFLNHERQPLYFQDHSYQLVKRDESLQDEIFKNDEIEPELLLANHTVKDDIQKSVINEHLTIQPFDKLHMSEDKIKDLKSKSDDFISLNEQHEEILSNEEMTLPVIDKKSSHSTAHLDNNVALINAKMDKITQENFSNQLSENDKIDSNRALTDDPIFNPQQGLQVDNAKKDFGIQAKFGNEEHVSSKHFEQELSNQVQIMVNANENSAKVNIDPPELGQIEIKIVQDADKTHIMFFANLEQTHDLIEAGLLRLRAQMEAQGLQLGNVTVSYNGTESNQSHTAKQHSFHQPSFSTQQVEDIQHSPINSTNNGLLDLYV